MRTRYARISAGIACCEAIPQVISPRGTARKGAHTAMGYRL
ncbi:hypothetical protein HMPREF3192_00289 [Atopobium deltae]|uniref:Uncharacterized protein n=1 Tax=Atopobium deltae TaxID=1393034 RepID=A0A133XWM2_9ACTN|nr:hypothetical protein HMPREF3192_00289 [Atopobium deltae]